MTTLEQAMAPGPKSAPSAVQLFAVLALAAAAYAPGLFHAFVYDDHGTIAENTFIEQPAQLGRVLTLRTLADPQVIDGQRPTLLLTAFLDRAMWGLNPAGWHLTSLLLHLAAAALLFRLLTRLDPAPLRPAVLTLLFALHPVLSEAVQMPSYREDLLAGLCGLAYLLACARGRAGGSLAWFALALLSKESAAALPGIALLLWWLVPTTRPPARRIVLHLAAAGLLLLAYGWAAFLERPAQALSVAWNGYSLPWPENLRRAPGIFLFYLRLLVAPWPLCADRAVPVFPFGPGLCVLCGLLFIGWRLRRARPLVTLGLGWLLLAFLPVSNLLPLFNPVGERYLYLLAPGFLLILAGLPPGRLVRGAAVAGALAFLILVPLRLRDWRSDETLWTSVLRVNPDSARAHTWLGLAAKQRGDRAEAARRFAQAEQLNPHDVTALINLAVLDGQAGDPAAAEARLREALRRRPDRPDVWHNLALALRLQGRLEEAAQAEAESATRRPRW